MNEVPEFSIYLDQNQWIYLAQASNKREGAEKYNDALQAVLKLVDSGTVVVPLSGIHMMETATPGNRERRERLARFMVQTSKLWCIHPFMSVRNIEVMYAIGMHFGCNVTNRIKSKIIGKGLPVALGSELKIEGVPEEIAVEAMKVAMSAETAVAMLVDGCARDTVAKLRTEDEEAASTLETIRARAQTLTDDMRHRVEVASLMHDQLLPILRTETESLGLTLPKLADSMKSPEDWLKFFHSIPTMDVFLTLGLYRDKQAGRVVDRNDLKDIGALTVAIPYCDIIVTENFFGHIANASGLAKKYGHVVLTDITQLPDKLRELSRL